ncbi:MAG: molybdate ABC transporter substrate-binding protein [Trueperaceae bacterium]|nr:molybdate ABC transporter substrate-binding protein [Trueperaceae bacterium]
MRVKTLFALLTTFALTTSALAQELTVFAASSLTEAFEEIADLFEGHNHGVTILLNFGGSSTLSTQIVQGAPADVFASADVVQMTVVQDAGLAVGEPAVFAHNRLVVIAPAGSKVSELEDLGDSGVLLVLAGPEVPVGRYSRTAIASLDAVYGAGFADRVLANLVSEEPNVRQVAFKIELGEADAAIVYSTDAAVLASITIIDIPEEHNVIATYPVVALKDSSQQELASAFVEFLLSPEAQAVLARRGFINP